MAVKKGALRIAIEDFLETFRFGKILLGWLSEIGEDHEQQIADFNPDLMAMIREIPDLPDAIQKLANLKPGDQAQGGILSMGGFATQIGQSMAGGILQPVVNLMNYAMEHIIHSARFDIPTLLEAERRGFIHEDTIKRVGSELGWDKDSRALFLELSNRLLGPGDLITLWRREEIGETVLDERLKEQAYDDETISELKVLTEIIPGVGDLINMAVKEAFNPGVVRKFGYDQEFPEKVAEWAEKQGMSREWAEYFWYAHWVVPSIGQGFEMLHRLRPGTTDNPFTVEDMRELLKTLDIPVYWRDKFIEISYNPLTRVDVRRMHDLGNLDEKGVLDAYLDSGYNQKNAELMRDFTLDYNKEPIKLLSKEVVLKAFKRGLFTESEAAGILVQAGWTSDQSQFYISIASYDMLEKETDLQTDLIHDYYIAGEIIKSDVHSQLNALNLPDSQTERLLKEWELEKLKKIRLPTEGELEAWYKLDYITSVDYEAGLVAKNYKPETVGFYIRQADEDISKTLQKQERDLLEAKEKIIAEGQASDYRIARADLDVQIAQEKANIAELKLVAHEIEEEEILDQIKTRIIMIKFIIKNLQLEKAQLKLAEEEETEE
jgi:hypothetical protein